MSLKAFIDYLEIEKNYSNNTIISYNNDLNSFENYISNEFSVKLIEDSNYSHIRSWIINLVDSGISNKSVNRKISSLNSFFKFCLKIGIIKENPLRNHRSLKIKKEIQLPFSENEMFDVLNEDNFENSFEGLRDRMIIELFYSTGIRRIELVNLKINDIDLSNNQIKVLGKRNKQRIIPLIFTTKDLILNYLKLRYGINSKNDYLFITNKGKKIYEKLVYRIINKYFINISTKVKKSPHIIRHSFATHLLNNGADLNSVKDLLGHSSLAATQVYTNRSIEEIKKVFAKSHPRNK